MWYLLCKEDVRATFELQIDAYGSYVHDVHILGTLPYHCKDIGKWLERRYVEKHRAFLDQCLSEHQCNHLAGKLQLTHGVSINDCFWVKSSEEAITWADVSLYRNEFNEVVQNYAFDGEGIGSISIPSTSPEFSTEGAYPKCWVRERGSIYMYKRAGMHGREPFCEVLAAQIYERMGAGISYSLTKYHDKIASKCELFNTEAYSYVPYYAYYGESAPSLREILSNYEKLNAYEDFANILVCDALTFNTDRHAGNHGVFVDSETLEVLRLAPGYDYNKSLFYNKREDAFENMERVIRHSFPRIGDDFVDVARIVLTDTLRSKLLQLKGIELVLPFYTEVFTEKRAKFMSAVVNMQIDHVLGKGPVVYVPDVLPGAVPNIPYPLQQIIGQK